MAEKKAKLAERQEKQLLLEALGRRPWSEISSSSAGADMYASGA